MTKEAFAETMHAALEALGVEAGTLVAGGQQTLAPRRHETAKEVLRALRAGETASSLSVELGEPLGVGGMGIVHLANQIRMGREVAVKSVRPEQRSERATVELLQEAWITGQLEHPNIVPVYDLALRDDGDPVVILKRLEGETWSNLLGDDEVIRTRYGADDPLAFHLRVLAQVCNAVRFAHSRGFIHRDIKPDNVQIGPFGEVYLLDWGIAVSTEDDGTHRFPLASECKGLAGTPAYMAPDMLGVYDQPVDQRADVYLLGATLFELLTGEPPHDGAAWGALVRSILLTQLEFPTDAPAGLVALVRRAMDPDPERRLQSADAFRLELDQFSQHRDADRLATRAASRQRDLLETMEAKDATSHAHREAVYRIFGECRFGYRSALELWPECETAREGLHGATIAMIRYELAGGQPEAAQGWLGQLESPAPELAEEVDRALDASRAERNRLKELESDIDPSIGRRTRFFVASVCGTLWVGIPLAGSLSGHRFDVSLGIYAALFVIVFGAGLFFWARESLSRTRINRNLTLSALAAVVVLLLTCMVSWRTGGSLRDAVVEAHLGWVAITSMAALSTDRRLLIACLGYLAGYVWLSLDPNADPMLGSAITNGVLLAVMVGLWASPREDLAGLSRSSMRTPPS